MSPADWIIRAATDDPPHGREQWAHAMRAEYATLTSGKLNWAIGCWMAMLGWRLRADALYLAVMLAVVYFWSFGSLTEYLVDISFKIIPFSVHRNEFFHPYLAAMLVVSVVLSAFRPDRVLVTAVAMMAIHQVSTVLSLVDLQRAFPEQNITWPIHPYNAQYFVAVFAEIGVCFVGANIGSAITKLWRRDRPQPPAVST
jgi:hypothetical protein